MADAICGSCNHSYNGLPLTTKHTCPRCGHVDEISAECLPSPSGDELSEWHAQEERQSRGIYFP
jgi:hypothetical protein